MGKYKPCPFCGGEVDPEGWMGHEERGPECEGCGATAPSMEVWEARADLTPFPLGVDPKAAFEHHVTSPNLFRSLAKRLGEFAVYVKVGSHMDGGEMEEGTIGPDCARASLVLTGLADVVEESQGNG